MMTVGESVMVFCAFGAGERLFCTSERDPERMATFDAPGVSAVASAPRVILRESGARIVVVD